MKQQSKINEVAMDVILHAGNGRMKVDDALERMCDLDFGLADEYLKEAEQEILKAHIAQTKVIQNQVSGGETEYSLLFIHAQDTIMTVNTEYRMATKIMTLTKVLKEKMEKEIKNGIKQ